MINFVKIFLFCYLINLILFYTPSFLSFYLFQEKFSLLQGIWGVRMGIFFNYAYLFLFILVSLYVLSLKFIRPYTKGAWTRALLSVTSSYLLFIFLSVIFICLRSNMRSTGFEFEAFLEDFQRIFIQALAIGILMIIFSPITYLIAVNHWLVTRYFFRSAIKK